MSITEYLRLEHTITHRFIGTMIPRPEERSETDLACGTDDAMDTETTHLLGSSSRTTLVSERYGPMSSTGSIHATRDARSWRDEWSDLEAGSSSDIGAYERYYDYDTFVLQIRERGVAPALATCDKVLVLVAVLAWMLFFELLANAYRLRE